MKTYHVGFLRGSGMCYPLHRNGARNDTLIIQAERNIDFLSPQLWKYMGERITTKKRLRDTASLTLAAVNAEYGMDFKRVKVV